MARNRLFADAGPVKLAVAASAFLVAGPWHSVAVSQSALPRTDAAVAKIGIVNVRELGVRVTSDGHPHVSGTVTCKRGGKLDYYGWDYDVSVEAIHRLKVHTVGPATCSITAVATISGEPVVLNIALLKR